jgi:predicted membrane-bound dolichyl-phosphate-mannose-protein mannosyltransferase
MLAAALVLIVAHEMAARRGAGRAAALTATIREEGPSLVVAFVVLPALVYLVAHFGVVRGSLLAWPWQAGSWWRSLAARHLLMLRHHAGFFGTHPYQSPPWSWLLLKRPIVYFFEPTGGRYREVLALGSPLVWWAAIAALAHVTFRWLRAKSLTSSEGTLLAGFVFAYVPWLVLGRHRTFVFLFYLLPAVPFLGVALAYAAQSLVRSRRGIVAVGGFCALSVILFIFYFPLLAAVPVDAHAWKARVGRFGTCAGYEEAAAPAPPSRPGPPPAGWCWR